MLVLPSTNERIVYKFFMIFGSILVTHMVLKSTVTAENFDLFASDLLAELCLGKGRVK